MLKIIKARKREKNKEAKSDDDDKRWWIFKRKSRIKPAREMKIEHHVNFQQQQDYDEHSYDEMNKYLDSDSNHYR